MDYNRLIHDYVDGTLDSSKEEEMFMIISSNEELRAEFRHLLVIKQAVKGDVMAFTPSAQSTMNIFSTLGFAPPPVAAPMPVPASTGYLAKLLSLMQNYSQGIIGGLMAASLTAVVMIAVFNNNGANNNIDKSSNTINKTFDKAIPKVESYSNDINTSAGQKENKAVVKYIYRTIYIEKKSNTVAGNNDIASDNEIKETSEAPGLINMSSVQPGQNRNINKSAAYNDRLPGSSSFNDLLIHNINPGNNRLGLTAELRGSQYWFMPGEATVNPEKFASFNNTSASLFYNLNDNISIGADIRQETFFQVFEGDSAGLKFRYSQQPNFTSYGLIMRYNPAHWGDFSPLGQVSIGGTSAGFIGRLMAGLAYSPYPDISFVLGIEYSGLRYTHQGQGYNASKLGLNYGVGFGF